jgi:ABC-type glycerol-3-phosphate transport system permease component
MSEQVQTSIPAARAEVRVAARRRSFRIPWGDLLIYVVLTLGALVVILPFLWMVSASFKPPGDILVYPPQLVPTTWTLENYKFVLEQTQFLVFVKNSLIVVACTITGHIISGSLVAYGFARFRFPGRNILFMILLGTLMVPFHAYMIPRFIIMKQLGVLDSLMAVILPYLFGGPVYIFLLRQFFMTIPRELDDAARIDGCNYIQLYWHILLPLARPALVTVGVIEFLAAWTSFLEPLIYLNSLDNYTVALGLSLFKNGFSGAVQWGPLMAATTLSAIAPLIVFFFAQKYLMGGIATMGLKG